MEPLACVQEIKYCYKYRSMGSNWTCNECISGYVNIGLECKPEILNCMNYTINSDTYLCDKCYNGFEFDSSKSCICGEGHYITSDNTCKECLDYCEECQEEVDGNIICLVCESGYDLIESKCKVPENIVSKTMIEKSAQATQAAMITSASVSMISLNFNSIIYKIIYVSLKSTAFLFNLDIQNYRQRFGRMFD
jgi:hypothetical protein